MEMLTMICEKLWIVMMLAAFFYLSRKRMAEKGLLHHERAGRRERIPGKAGKREKKTGDLEKIEDELPCRKVISG